MPTLSDGARQLPLRHLTIRVPWSDNSWTGCVCEKPADNISCLILRRIREQRNDTLEKTLAGKPWNEIEEGKLPPCVSERCGFMMPSEFTRTLKHPYSATSKAHEHMLPTPFRFPAYSAACLPFGWMLKEKAEEKARELDLRFDPEREDRAHEEMGFKTEWVQTKYNQLVMLDTFFSAISPEKSLCFMYAKRVPLVEDSRRVIIGAGWVQHIGLPVEYRYKEKGKLDSILWERPVQHSIRAKFQNGFLFPYHELMEYAQNHPEEDPSQYVAFAPDEHFGSYSYASEHLTNDGAIASLLACLKALENIRRAVDGPWDKVKTWIDSRLNELWNMRGPCPGLGAALHAFGVQHGNLLALEIEKLYRLDKGEDPWVMVDHVLRDPSKYPPEITNYVTPTITKKWKAVSSERQSLLKLLSRMELTNDQAACYYVREDKRRKRFRIDVTDIQLIENPYLLFEQDRLSADPISLPLIDRGIFSKETLRRQFPLPKPSSVSDGLDERRVRAFVIQQLEKASAPGHTLVPKEDIISQIRELEIEPPCPVDSDMMSLVEQTFGGVIGKVEMADGKPAYQLKRYGESTDRIRKSVQNRLKGKRHEADVNWRESLDTLFKGPPASDDQQEIAARREKAAALAELFASRISVLIGPAGTGKTTLLKVLCAEKIIKGGGVLALAPTGKARVRFEQQTGISGAKTLAQFLMPLDRYEPETGIYRFSDQAPISIAKTVIIDEASMLTEEQLAATLDALTGVERLILVGDPRQLPPIGAGRPFLDIVEHIRTLDIEGKFPRVMRGYAELTVRRRQVGEMREDLLLSDWFSGRPVDPGADEIWAKVTEEGFSKHLKFINWSSSQDLQTKLLKALVEELKLKDENDVAGFEISLGGSPFKDFVFFHCGREGSDGACKKAENWQILSPVRNHPHGVEGLNRFIQSQFRQKTKDWATQRWRKIPKPMGREEIVYGDKVINLKNQQRKDVYPEKDALSYVANGEIGIVVGQYKGRSWKPKSLPWKIEVEFTSQPCFKYGYTSRDFGEEAEPKLELAYALTVHKVQGSEFGITFLVVPNPCWLLSRELLYTALTRQQNRVVIFHQGNPNELKKYASDYYSESARRLTNLFTPPSKIELKDRFLEERLIHRTRRGDSVRSKSEVIIADLLYSRKIEYTYEAPLTGKDGTIRYPDFTFEDDESGIKIFWEHLGMLHVPEYRERWEKKLLWFKEQGILPIQEGGGPEGTLVFTMDDEHGGIQSDAIEKILNEIIS